MLAIVIVVTTSNSHDHFQYDDWLLDLSGNAHMLKCPFRSSGFQDLFVGRLTSAGGLPASQTLSNSQLAKEVTDK